MSGFSINSISCVGRPFLTLLALARRGVVRRPRPAMTSGSQGQVGPIACQSAARIIYRAAHIDPRTPCGRGEAHGAGERGSRRPRAAPARSAIAKPSLPEDRFPETHRVDVLQRPARRLTHEA